MHQDLQGRICAVTGAAGRIGRAIVENLALAGGTIIASDVAEGLHFDTGGPGKVEYGRLDCVINNGAIGGGMVPLHAKDLKEYSSIMDINVRGSFLLMQAALRLHINRRKTSDDQQQLVIVNVASTAASHPELLGSIYSMSKAALVSLTKSVAKEYGDQQVRCVAVSPGMMDVPNVQGFSSSDLAKIIKSIPLQRSGAPHEVANLITWLVSDKASYVTGTEIIIDGGRLA
ncbi:hypothetical protein I352_05331 [Cryptococcus deuterogattii MMRL2647]|nr:hypothetical protein I352_05331 [Cryptococcus deuterogattii MMRL2647]